MIGYLYKFSTIIAISIGRKNVGRLRIRWIDDIYFEHGTGQ